MKKKKLNDESINNLYKVLGVKPKSNYPQLLDHCQTCRHPKGKLTPSHLIKTNHVHKTLRDKYDYYDPKNYLTQCEGCHREFELLGTKRKLDFPNLDTRQDYLRVRGLWTLAARVDRLISEWVDDANTAHRKRLDK